MPYVVVWPLEPGCGSWEPVYYGSSFWSSLDEVMLEESLICQSVQLPCVVIFELSYSMFFQLTVTVPFLMCSAVDNVLPNAT